MIKDRKKQAKPMAVAERASARLSVARKYTPAVARFWLLLIAGLLWTSIGIALCVVALSWLSSADWPENAWVAAAGFGSGLLVYRFGFSGIVRKNLTRISQLPERACLFAFQAWHSYLLVVIMASLGFTLRHSHLSRLILAAVYLTIGAGLALSSTLYYREIV